ncbi:MAG: pilus assembly protein PilM, partial [Candidatus Sungbacteria bacterium]|nr:pilus assembly protein PilM [Candidatus Sungbacteria bacterium]
MTDISFLKKLIPPGFSFKFLKSKPSGVVGINIGSMSTKVVQLRYESERAILETYGELSNEGYLKNPDAAAQASALRYLDSDIAVLLKDVLRESKVTVRNAVLSIPVSAAFVTLIPFPRTMERDIAAAIPYEARKYVPIPIVEVVFEWMAVDPAESGDEIRVLLVAVHRQVIEKYLRVAQLVGINLVALEVESFSMARSLIGTDNTPTAIVNLGHQSTALTLVDRGTVRLVHTVGHGSQDLTRALERGLSVDRERAEVAKKDIGLSERIEEREIASVLTPLVETLLAEIERFLSLYNRKAQRKIQKVILTG